MKKIIFIVTSLNAGGIENYLLRFVKHYEGQIEPIIICKNGLSGELQLEFKKIQNIKFYDDSLGYLNPKLFLKLLHFFKERQPDVVCDFTGNFAGIPLWLAKKANVEKRVAFYRGSTDHFTSSYLKNYYNNQMKNLVLKYATNVLANSHTAMNYFFDNNHLEDIRFEVIYNGIDAEKFLGSTNDLRKDLGIDKDAFVVGHVGRYDSSKNHKTIIKVIEELVSLDENITFLLCGKNVDVELNNWVETKNLQSKVKLMGYSDNVIEVLNTLDCFYFPSITEGQPNALLEALIVGLPFVTSNIQPIKEIIPQEFSEQLIDPEDSHIACQKILQIKNNKDLQESLNLSTWAKRNFDGDKLFAKFYKVLN